MIVYDRNVAITTALEEMNALEPTAWQTGAKKGRYQSIRLGIYVYVGYLRLL